MKLLVNPLWGKTINWRAGCGRSASPVRREGETNKPFLPTPIKGSKKEEGNESAGRAPADLHPPLVEILPSLALQASKEMQSSRALATLKNIYASGKVAPTLIKVGKIRMFF